MDDALFETVLGCHNMPDRETALQLARALIESGCSCV